MKRNLILLTFPILALTSCGTIASYDPWHYKDADKYEAGNKEFTSYSNIKSLEIDWDEGQVTILGSSEASSITVYETPNRFSEDRYLVHTYLDNKGKLNVKPGQSGIFSLEDTDPDFKGFKTELTITVPLDFKFESIRCSTYSTTYVLENLKADKIKTTNTNGGNRFNNITADFIEADTWTSSIEVNAVSVRAFVSRSTYGSQSLSFTSVPKTISSTATRSGNVRVYLPENDGFTIECGARTVDTDFDVVEVYEDDDPEKKDTRTLVYKDGSLANIYVYSFTGKTGVYHQ